MTLDISKLKTSKNWFDINEEYTSDGVEIAHIYQDAAYCILTDNTPIRSVYDFCVWLALHSLPKEISKVLSNNFDECIGVEFTGSFETLLSILNNNPDNYTIQEIVNILLNKYDIQIHGELKYAQIHYSEIDYSEFTQRSDWHDIYDNVVLCKRINGKFKLLLGYEQLEDLILNQPVKYINVIYYDDY